MRFLILLATFVLALAGAVAWVHEDEPDWYLRARYPLEYEQLIRASARRRDLDPALVAAVIYAESRFDPNAHSSAGAVGLMQVLPDTAEFIARKTDGEDFVLADLRDPEINVRYGTWLLDYLRDYYDGDLSTALAAYHAGPGNVDEWRRQGQGILFPETEAYVREVERVRQIYERAYGRELLLSERARPPSE
jgi:soluble lytic murein transglycosylase